MAWRFIHPSIFPFYALASLYFYHLPGSDDTSGGGVFSTANPIIPVLLKILPIWYLLAYVRIFKRTLTASSTTTATATKRTTTGNTTTTTTTSNDADYNDKKPQSKNNHEVTGEKINSPSSETATATKRTTTGNTSTPNNTDYNDIPEPKNNRGEVTGGKINSPSPSSESPPPPTKTKTSAAVGVVVEGVEIVPSLERSYRNYVSLALAVSSIGDVLMASKASIIPGGVVFGVAHLLYVAAFRTRGTSHAKLSYVASPLAVVSVYTITSHLTYSVVMVIFIFLYNLMITATVITALCCHESNGNWVTLSAAVGASLFGVSDYVIALDLFVTSVPHAQWVIMMTYYAAQLCLAQSVVG